MSNQEGYEQEYEEGYEKSAVRTPRKDDMTTGALAQRMERLEEAVQRLWNWCAARDAEERARREQTDAPGPINPDPSCEAQEERSRASETSENAAPDAAGDAGPLLEVWRMAPLASRLDFLLTLAASDMPLHRALSEARALADLLQRESDLENWIDTYPDLFADAATALDLETPTESPTERVAQGLLEESRAALERRLLPLGIEWIRPQPGDVITDASEVIGEEAVRFPPGTTARLGRKGFRRNGAVCARAYVYRAAQVSPPASATPPVRRDGERRQPPSEQPPTVGPHGAGLTSTGGIPPGPRFATTNAPGAAQTSPAEAAPDAFPADWTPEATTRTPNTASLPEPPPVWLQQLRRRSLSVTAPEAPGSLKALETIAVEGPRASNPDLPDSAFRSLFTPILWLIGARVGSNGAELDPEWAEALNHVRGELENWLVSACSVRLFSPPVGAPFDPETMEATGVRRTAHLHEHGTVARVELIGILRMGRPLFHARVLLYDAGANR